MSVENAKKFQKDLGENEELRKKFNEEMNQEGVSAEKDYKTIVKIAQNLGYDITEEDFVTSKSANIEGITKEELSEEELDKVAGGAFFCGPDAPDGHEVGCFIAWYASWEGYITDSNYRCYYGPCREPLGKTHYKNFPIHGSSNRISAKCPVCGLWTNARDLYEGLKVTKEPWY